MIKFVVMEGQLACTTLVPSVAPHAFARFCEDQRLNEFPQRLRDFVIEQHMESWG